MIELAALGFLLQEPLNGYRLKQKLELFMCGCVSANYGTIYPLLRRLEAKGAISMLSTRESGNAQKVYSITEQGRRLWKHKMLEHPQESWVNAESRFMIKFFFFSYLDSEERVKLLKHRLMVCQLHIDDLDTQVTRDRYQENLMQYGRSNLQQQIQWLNQNLRLETSNTSLLSS